MKLTDLDPRWLYLDDRQVGFCFRSPKNEKWYQSCFFEQVERRVQWKLLSDELGHCNYQACDSDTVWTREGDFFKDLTVSPSLDGSKGGLWHGYIIDGQIVGDY